MENQEQRGRSDGKKRSEVLAGTGLASAPARQSFWGAVASSVGRREGCADALLPPKPELRQLMLAGWP